LFMKGEACFCTCIDILKPGKPALRDKANGGNV
jgi:hypothetical protein